MSVSQLKVVNSQPISVNIPEIEYRERHLVLIYSISLVACQEVNLLL